MQRDAAGLLEYLLVIGAVLTLALYELIAVSRQLRRDERMRKGSSERTHVD